MILSSCFKKIAILFVVLAFFIYPFSGTTSTAHAQAKELTINVAPKYPKPFQTVYISIEDYSRNLNNSQVSWTVNGTTEERGIGIKQHSVKVGGLGTITNVSVNVDGVSHQVTLRPTVVDLIWQANTYTPPFYQGKALHSNQDPVTVIAEPFFIATNGTKVSPQTLTYKWSLNGKVDGGASGYGKKSFQIIPSILIQPLEVKVEVSSADNIFRSENSITIPNTPPEVLFYEDNPLTGILFENALNSKEIIMNGDEMTIFGAPLFFSKEDERFGQLSYVWKLNSSTLGSQIDNRIIFRKPEDQDEGRSLISLDIKNNNRFTQSTKSSFYLNFKNENSNNESGWRSIF